MATGSNATKKLPRHDIDSGGVISISTEHAHIHRGKAYVCSFVDSLASGAFYDTLIFVPTGVFPHLRLYEYDTAAAPCDLYLYESPVIAHSGDVCAVHNANLTSTNVSSVGVTNASSVSSVGAFKEVHKITGGKQSGGTHEGALTEWDLNENKVYLVRLHNVSGGALGFGAFHFWYE